MGPNPKSKRNNSTSSSGTYGTNTGSSYPYSQSATYTGSGYNGYSSSGYENTSSYTSGETIYLSDLSGNASSGEGSRRDGKNRSSGNQTKRSKSKGSAVQTDKQRETKYPPLKNCWFPPPCCPPFCFQPRPVQIIIDRFIPPIGKKGEKKSKESNDERRISTESNESSYRTVESSGPGKPRVIQVFKNPNEPFCPINLDGSLWREECQCCCGATVNPCFHNCCFYHFSGKGKDSDQRDSRSSQRSSQRENSEGYSSSSGSSNNSSSNGEGTSNESSSRSSKSGSYGKSSGSSSTFDSNNSKFYSNGSQSTSSSKNNKYHYSSDSYTYKSSTIG